MSQHAVSNKGRATAGEDDTTRRAALRTLVGATALAIPAIGAWALPDPIFAAIARHKAACEAPDATRFAMDDLVYAPDAKLTVGDPQAEATERLAKKL